MSRALRHAAAVAVLATTFSFVRWWDFTLPSAGHERYQAVFLANGQTYFGRYYDRIGPYAKIVAPHYIQSEGESSRIVRRGNELHGPDAEMLIPKTAILFVEDLSPSSPVAGFMAKESP